MTVRRGKIKTAAELPPLPPKGYFSRFAAAADGISDRVLPGTANGMHLVTGLEHDVAGRPSEAAANRIAQTDKRLGKLATVAERFSLPLYRQTPHEQPDLLVIGAGGSRGAIEEAVASLNAAGYRVNHVHLRLLQPLPLPQLRPLLAAAKRILTVEHNASAQLAVLLGAEAGRPLHSLRKYDGNILLPAEVYQACREVLA